MEDIEKPKNLLAEFLDLSSLDENQSTQKRLATKIWILTWCKHRTKARRKELIGDFSKTKPEPGDSNLVNKYGSDDDQGEDVEEEDSEESPKEFRESLGLYSARKIDDIAKDMAQKDYLRKEKSIYHITEKGEQLQLLYIQALSMRTFVLLKKITSIMKSARIATLIDKKASDIDGVSTNSQFLEESEQNFREIEDLVKKTLGLESKVLDNIQGSKEQRKVFNSLKKQIDTSEENLHPKEISELHKLVTEPLFQQENL
jgi:hypothetical protein